MEGDLPVEIAPEEIIVRAVKTPYHLDAKKKRLKYQAFKPQPECDDVSVMRKRHLSNDGCKDKAVEIAGAAYIGLAALRADEIATAKAHVVDSREGQFLGHAHIEQGIVAPVSGQTADPDLIERWKTLADVARYYPDPEIGHAGWRGPDIV